MPSRRVPLGQLLSARDRLADPLRGVAGDARRHLRFKAAAAHAFTRARKTDRRFRAACFRKVSAAAPRKRSSQSRATRRLRDFSGTHRIAMINGRETGEIESRASSRHLLPPSGIAALDKRIRSMHLLSFSLSHTYL